MAIAADDTLKKASDVRRERTDQARRVTDNQEIVGAQGNDEAFGASECPTDPRCLNVGEWLL